MMNEILSIIHGILIALWFIYTYNQVKNWNWYGGGEEVVNLIFRIFDKLTMKMDQFLCGHVGESAYGIFEKGTRPPVQKAIGCRSCGKVLNDDYDCDDSGESIIYKVR